MSTCKMNVCNDPVQPKSRYYPWANIVNPSQKMRLGLITFRQWPHWDFGWGYKLQRRIV